MANVRKYTEQIASAKKGKDVRAAIVSAINEVSDENNTYNQTKADIQAAQKSINADVTKNQQTQQDVDRFFLFGKSLHGWRNRQRHENRLLLMRPRADLSFRYSPAIFCRFFRMISSER